MHISFEEMITNHKIDCIIKDCCVVNKVANEKGKRFEIVSADFFTKIRIDNCLIKSEVIEKCDFGFIRNSNNDFYFVELKGTNIKKAFDQIVATINNFETNLIKISKEKRFGFIISSSIPKAGISSNIIKQTFTKKYGKILEIKNRELKYIPR